MKVTYIGDPLDGFEGPAAITVLGETFEKNRARTISDDHPFATKFRENPTFQVDGQDPPVREDVGHTPTPMDDIKAKLDGKGVKYRANASLANLQELLAEAEDAPSEVAGQSGQPPVG